jgi:acyl carrier protein
MDREEIKQIVFDTINSALDAKIQLTEDMNNDDIENWSSLIQAIVITNLQDKFNIKFKLKDINRWSDLKSLIDIISEKQ